MSRRTSPPRPKGSPLAFRVPVQRLSLQAKPSAAAPLEGEPPRGLVHRLPQKAPDRFGLVTATLPEAPSVSIPIVPISVHARASASHTTRLVAALAGSHPRRAVAPPETPPPAPGARKRTLAEQQRHEAWAGRYRDVARYLGLLDRTLAHLEPHAPRDDTRFSRARSTARIEGRPGPQSIEGMLTKIQTVAFELRSAAEPQRASNAGPSLPLREALTVVTPLIPASIQPLPWNGDSREAWLGAAKELVGLASAASVFLPAVTLGDPPPTQRQAQRVFDALASTSLEQLDRAPMHEVRRDVRKLHAQLREAARALYLAASDPGEAA